MKHDYTTLLHFLRTGELGQLKCNMSLERVRAYLGEPDTSIKGAINATTERLSQEYGCLTLRFNIRRYKNAKRISIFRMEIDTGKFPEYILPLNLGDGWLSGLCQMSYMEIENFLIEHNIDFNVYQLDDDHFRISIPQQYIIMHYYAPGQLLISI